MWFPADEALQSRIDEVCSGSAQVPQTQVWMLSVVSQGDIALHSSTATSQFHMRPYQGLPCSIQMALGVPTKLLQKLSLRSFQKKEAYEIK